MWSLSGAWCAFGLWKSWRGWGTSGALVGVHTNLKISLRVALMAWLGSKGQNFGRNRFEGLTWLYGFALQICWSVLAGGLRWLLLVGEAIDGRARKMAATDDTPVLLAGCWPCSLAFMTALSSLSLTCSPSCHLRQIVTRATLPVISSFRDGRAYRLH